MIDNGFWMAIATIVAVIVGPVAAVLVTRYMDRYRAGKERKMDIFRTLMRTRRLTLHWEHVGALNLIEVEFIDHDEVINAWKAYFSNLGEDFPKLEEANRYEAAMKKRSTLLTKLIAEIAKVLGIKVEQLDILEGNYVPKGWEDAEWEWQLVRRYLINVLSQKSAILVKSQQPQQNQGPYPAPPDLN